VPGHWHQPLEQRFPPRAAARTRAAAGAERLKDSAGLLDTIRLVKTDAELERLRESARMTEIILAAATEVIRPGVDENTIAAEGARAPLAAGSEFMSLQPIVVSGPRSSVIHPNHQQRIVEEGDPVFLEFGAVRHRYTAPMMRTAVAGTPTAEMQRMNETCHQLHDVLARTMAPGNRFDDAAAAAEEVLAPVADRAFSPVSLATAWAPSSRRAGWRAPALLPGVKSASSVRAWSSTFPSACGYRASGVSE